jgi:hypothetical protein
MQMSAFLSGIHCGAISTFFKVSNALRLLLDNFSIQLLMWVIHSIFSFAVEAYTQNVFFGDIINQPFFNFGLSMLSVIDFI